jgi:hypothetical protein
LFGAPKRPLPKTRGEVQEGGMACARRQGRVALAGWLSVVYVWRDGLW